MCDKSRQRVEEFSESHGLSGLRIDAQSSEDSQWVVTINANSSGGVPIEESAFGDSEADALNKAIDYFVNRVIKSKAGFSAPDSSAQNNPVNVSQVTSSQSLSDTSVHSSEQINDEVSHIPNCVGYLNEICQKKSYKPPAYEVLSQSGEPHNPLFSMQCNLDANGVLIEGKGKGCPKSEAKKRAAQDVIRKLREREANAAKAAQTAAPMTWDINAYFSKKSQNSPQLEQLLVDNSSDYFHKLERMAVLLDCRMDYILSQEVPNHVVLRLVVEESDYPLVTTFAASGQGVDDSRLIAAKKAVLKIKILFTNEDN